ncbi:serine/threonine-protein kinase [Herbiconiux sp. SYSU D00978]|uniref:hypothetical protein n=1 Tax=Herbiconiux sp. SYSU D00978 TaxID=2812562 RepID=UPI001A95BCE5|nr:hypothetical protein [Herbiconiux sp. SYSU D00978]
METIAGLTLTRRLAEGERSIVWHARGASGSGYAVKVFAPHVDADAIDRELDALARAQGPHVVPLLDVSADARGATALVLRRLRPAPLSSLVAERGPLAVGEAITVLAPLAAAVARLHASGLAHGRLDAGSVLFDAAGAPFLASFGRARALAESSNPLPEARLALLPEVVADARALRALAAALVPPGVAPAWLTGDEVPPERFAAVLAERAFELGDATAVSFDSPAATLRPADEVRSAAGPPAAVAARPARAWLAAAPLPPAVLDAVESAIASVSAGAGLLRRFRLGRVSPRAWLLLGGAAALLMAAIALPRTEATASDPAAPPGDGATADTEPAGVEPGSPPALGDAVTGDDPLAAAQLLIQARETCLRDLSVLCLEAVHQQGAPIATADAELVEAMRTGTELSLPRPEGLHLVERLGDTAILAGTVETGASASVVVSRGEAGWRLREVRVDTG